MFSLRDLRFLLCSFYLDVLRAQRIIGFLSLLPTSQRGRNPNQGVMYQSFETPRTT